MVALHARRSFASVQKLRTTRPGVPVIVALTGTDLYGDIHTSPLARKSLLMASRLIVLQPMGLQELPDNVRAKTRVIYQSARRPKRKLPPDRKSFTICIIGHLRPVKDPFRAAEAARLLPHHSQIRIVQVGAALSREMAQKARAEAATNPRYKWLEELPRWNALRVLARSHLMALTSELEGGANVISESLAASVPVVSSRIGGSLGILGVDYPGYFPVGDTEALGALMMRAESDRAFYRNLSSRCRRLRHLSDPAREKRSWRSLLRELPIK